MTTVKKLWICIGVLALLSPFGLLIPALFGAGGAWGEWSLEEIKKSIGYLPEGMKRLGHLWGSPMKDYAVPGQPGSPARKGLGYMLSAFLGVGFTACLAYLLARALGRKNK